MRSAGSEAIVMEFLQFLIVAFLSCRWWKKPIQGWVSPLCFAEELITLTVSAALQVQLSKKKKKHWLWWCIYIPCLLNFTKFLFSTCIPTMKAVKESEPSRLQLAHTHIFFFLLALERKFNISSAIENWRREMGHIVKWSLLSVKETRAPSQNEDSDCLLRTSH